MNFHEFIKDVLASNKVAEFQDEKRELYVTPYFYQSRCILENILLKKEIQLILQWFQL